MQLGAHLQMGGPKEVKEKSMLLGIITGASVAKGRPGGGK